MDLFESSNPLDSEPLAARMRPRNLDEYIGQDHIIGKGRLLRRAIQADQLSSLIFYGPPGTGKTTLARVIAGTTKSLFLSINAVLSGVKQIREAIDEASENRKLYGKRTILFVDEVHRWNKAQQDALLPWVENGTFILIGATTENPYFEVNSALVSRSRIFQLRSLTPKDLLEVAKAAVKDKSRGYGAWNVVFDEDVLEHLVEKSAGDARTLLNSLQLAVETTPQSFPPPPGETIHITMTTAEESIQQKAVLYDKEGDYHYDTISAFIKSIRGSDPDAALYWLTRMVKAGEAPNFIWRRLLISASEDIGLADPNAITVITSLAAAFDRVGMPEGAFFLTQATLYLSSTKKSNTAMAYFDALKAVEEENLDVPNHLKDDSRDKHGFGHGEGYKYPHAFRDHWVAQAYLPNALKGRIFYKPSDQGWEKQVQESVLSKREAQIAVMMDSQPEEILTFSPGDKKRDRWIKRTEGYLDKNIRLIRDKVYDFKIPRHYAVLVIGDNGGSFLWEAYRRVPEGCVHSIINSRDSYDILNYYVSTLDSVDKPELYSGELKNYTSEMQYELITAKNIFTKSSEQQDTLDRLLPLLKEEGQLILSQIIPCRSTRISEFFKDEDQNLLKEAEKLIYSEETNPLINWDEESLSALLESRGLKTEKTEKVVTSEKRVILTDNITAWFSPTGSYGRALSALCDQESTNALIQRVRETLQNREVLWESENRVISCIKEP